MNAILGAVLFTCLTASLGGVAWWLNRRFRVTPEDRERRRRLTVHAYGRMTDGEIVDYHEGIIYYAYTAGGVSYAAAQDVTALLDLLGASPETLIGPVTVKYSVRNAANSIVVCEDWAGFRARQPVETEPSGPA